MTVLNHIRCLFHKNCCFSDLFLNDKFICSVLEPPDKDLKKEFPVDLIYKIKTGNSSAIAIPYGQYELGLRWSASLSNKYIDLKDRYPEWIVKTNESEGLLLPYIKDVPAFEYIMYHTGQFDYHTKGCPLTRQNKIYGGYAGSREAFIKLMDNLYAIRDEIKKSNVVVKIKN